MTVTSSQTSLVLIRTSVDQTLLGVEAQQCLGSRVMFTIWLKRDLAGYSHSVSSSSPLQPSSELSRLALALSKKWGREG